MKEASIPPEIGAIVIWRGINNVEKAGRVVQYLTEQDSIEIQSYPDGNYRRLYLSDIIRVESSNGR